MVSFAGGSLQLPISLARAGVVNVRLYSVLGNEVANVSELMNAGVNKVQITKKNIPSGVYMLSVQAGSTQVVKRLDLSR